MTKTNRRAMRATLVLSIGGAMMAFGVSPRNQLVSVSLCGGLDADTLAPRGNTGEGSGGGIACPDAQPTPANTTPLIWDDPMIGQLGGACDLDQGVVDGYHGVYYPPFEPSVPGPPALGPDVIAGLAYNSASAGNCKTGSVGTPISGLTGCPDDPGIWHGMGFFDVSRPQLAISSSKDYLFLYYDNRHRLGFKQVGSSDAYAGVNGNTMAAERVSISDGQTPSATWDVYKVRGRGGKVYWFFGDLTSGGTIKVKSTTGITPRIKGQLWKATVDNGESNPPVSYVGEDSPSTSGALDLPNAYAGFDLCGTDLTPRVKTMWDGAGRRNTYTYTSSGNPRCSSITVAKQVSSSWVTVSSANFVYDNAGPSGSSFTERLRLIQTVIELSASGTQLYRYQYIEYENNSGVNQHKVNRVVGPEGVRAFAYGASGVTFTSASSVYSYLSSNSGSLNPYSSSVVTYDSNGRVATAFSNGQCGCSGVLNGTHSYTYEDNADLTDVPGTYEGSGTWWAKDLGASPQVKPKWKRRMIRTNPDGTSEVTYYDDLAQVLAKVRCQKSPTTVDATQRYFATVYERDTDGRVSKVYAPECVLSYEHSSGSFTFSESTGLIRRYKYKTAAFDGTDTTSGKYLTGRVVTQTEINEPSTSGVTYRIEAQYDYNTSSDWYVDYPAGSSGDQARLAKPILTASRVLNSSIASGSTPASTDYDETTYSYVFWGSSAIPWAPKKVTTTMPAVATATNGSGSTTSTSQWIDQHTGRVAFSSMPDGRLHFFKHDASTGQILKRVEDVDAGDSDASSAASAFSGVGLSLPSSGTGTRATSTYEYDTASRLNTATAPSVSSGSGRTSYYWYTKIAGELPVTISGPRLAGTAYYGPATVTVSNQSGRSVSSGLLTLSGTNNSTTTSPQGWIDSSKTALASAVQSPATLVRLNHSEYDTSGTRLAKSGPCLSWNTTTGAITGSDDTLYLYDSMGRVVGVKDPTGTIRRTEFDFLGRPTAQLIGTNDYDALSSAVKFSTSTPNNMTPASSTTFNEYDPPSQSYFIARSTVASASQDPDGTNIRTTTYTYDYRNRPLLVTAPVAPHSLTSYDFRGRATGAATYSSTGSVTPGTTDPTASGTATGRLSAVKMEYDSRGRAWRTTQYKIDQSNGNRTSDTLVSQSWFDDDGHLIKSVSPGGITKHAYDRMDRVVTTYTLAKAVSSSGGDEAYADADDVANDTVLEQSHTTYDPTSGAVLWSMNLSRLHHVTATGALDASGQPDAALARAQITATWYDDLDRPIASANYGTNHATANGASFTRPSTVPTRSDTVLVASTVYNDDGTVGTTTDPKNITSKTLYDSLGRRVASISNFVNGTPDDASNKDDDHYVRYAYQNGLLRHMWVDIAGNDTSGTPPASLTGSDINDQVTEYVYGTTKGTPAAGVSRIATGHLLQKAIYPPQSSAQAAADRSVLSAYNALGELVWTQDQNGTVLTTTYDNGGRITSRVVTTVGSGTGINIDATVRRIDLAYTSRGQVESVVQYDATASGNALNGLKYTYDDWGNTTKLEQDRDSAVGGSGAAALAVDWAYSYTAGGTTRPRVSRSSTTLPGSFTITNSFASGTDADIGRVTALDLPDGIEEVQYKYLGAGSLVNTTLTGPARVSKLYDGSNVYDAIDRFNRVVVNRWTNTSSSSDVFRAEISYDRNSNITAVYDPLDKVAGTRVFDTNYTMDDLNRVVKADRGTLSSGSITGSSRYTQDWTLSQTGNWTNTGVDLNGAGGAEFTDDRTHNNANEILTRPDPTKVAAHDPAGQMTDDGNRYAYKYDAFGRMVSVSNRSNNTVIAEYVYDGLGQRIGGHSDVNASGGGPNASDPWYWFVYDDRWRIVSTFRVAGGAGSGSASFRSSGATTDSYAKERFIYHNAGRDGLGGSSYIDSMVMARRDLSTSWGSAADSDLESWHYTLANWRNDTVRVEGRFGGALAGYRYTAYGARTELPVADFDGDGFVDGSDYDAFVECYETGDCPVVGGVGRTADWNGDGFVDGDDYDAFIAAFEGDVGKGGQLRHLYAGYESDPILDATDTTAAIHSTYHVRHRVYSTELGRWTRRDPIGYVDGLSLYQAMRSSPVRYRDFRGLCATSPDDNLVDWTEESEHWKSVSDQIAREREKCKVKWSPMPDSLRQALRDGTATWEQLKERCESNFCPFDHSLDCQVTKRNRVHGRVGFFGSLATYSCWRYALRATDRLGEDASNSDQEFTRHCVLACCLARQPWLTRDDAMYILEIQECCLNDKMKWADPDTRRDSLRDWQNNLIGIEAAHDKTKSCEAACAIRRSQSKW